MVNGKPVYELVAEKVMEWGAMSMDGEYSNVGAVVGATYPEMSRILRKLMPHTYFLVPGYGAQGGTAEDLKYCFNEDGLGAIVNSSRGIIAAYKKDTYAKYWPRAFRRGFPSGSDRYGCRYQQRIIRRRIMAKVKETAQVISQEQLSDDIFSMWIHTEAIASQAHAGQFISVYSNDGSECCSQDRSVFVRSIKNRADCGSYTVP